MHDDIEEKIAKMFKRMFEIPKEAEKFKKEYDAIFERWRMAIERKDWLSAQKFINDLKEINDKLDELLKETEEIRDVFNSLRDGGGN